MTVLSRELVRDEIATGLASALTGSGKPVSSVYNHQKGKLSNESPVVLVMARSIDRRIDGIGAKRYRSIIGIELHVLVYDGDKSNPLSESQREDRLDTIEAAIADWAANNQSGTNYQALEFTSQPTEVMKVPNVDGSPYLLEIITFSVEAKDL